jgi:hypothetical protein
MSHLAEPSTAPVGAVGPPRFTKRTGLALVVALVALTLTLTAQADEFAGALQHLQALRSVVQAGLPYAEHQRRVLDAKPVVDRYLARADNSFKPQAVRQAMELYVAAIGTWSTSFSATLDAGIIGPVAQYCPIAGSFLTDTVQWIKYDRETRWGISDREVTDAMNGAVRDMVPILWACAADFVSDAEGQPRVARQWPTAQRPLANKGYPKRK